MRTPNKKCCICGKGLYRRPSEIVNKKIFFCKEHRSQAMKENFNLFPVEGLVIGRTYWKDKKLPYKPTSRKSKEYHNVVCLTCKKEYTITDADKRWGIRRKYCSQKCYMKNPSRKDTDIELILEEWLNDNNIKYEKQKKIFKTFPDFFIKPNICIYADGDYWHDRPERIEVDNRINKQLLNSNYVVIRLKGSEIYAGKRPQLC